MSPPQQLDAESLSKFHEKQSISDENLDRDRVEVRKLYKSIQKTDFLRWILGFMSLVTSISSISYFISHINDRSWGRFCSFILFAITFVLFCICCALLRLIQSGVPYFVKCIPDVQLSNESKDTIESLRNGRLRAHFVTASPVSNAAMFRASDGEKLDNEISSRLFKSLFCPLLLIDNPDYWHFVLADYRNIFSGIRRPIYVQTSPSLKLDEPATFAHERTIESEEDRLKSHWRHSIPPDLRTEFCKTFIRIGKWRDDDAIKVRSALNAVLEYDQSVPLRGGQEQRAFLARVAINALTTAQKREGFSTLWLSKGAEGNGDPTQSLSKFFGYAKDHDYVRYRIETFKEMGLKDQSSISN